MAEKRTFLQDVLGQGLSSNSLSPITPGNYGTYLADLQSKKYGKSMWANREVNGFLDPKLITDPVSVGFKLYFRFDEHCGLLADEKYPNSALYWLKTCNLTERYYMLKDFITLLKDINMNYHFLFKDIEGIEEVKKAKPQTRFDGESSNIRIKTFETIDFKIQQLISLYDTIWQDKKYGREILPKNLRRFSLAIFVYALGSYQVVSDPTKPPGVLQGNVGTAGDYLLNVLPNKVMSDSSVVSKTITNIASSIFGDMEEMYVKGPDMYNHIMYEFSECEFVPWESSQEFKPSNSDTSFVENDICISYRWVTDSWRFAGIAGSQIFGNFILASTEKSTILGKASKFNLLTSYNKLKDGIFNSEFMQNNSFVASLAKTAFQNVAGNLDQTITGLAEKYGTLDKLRNEAIGFIQDAASNLVDKYSKMLGAKVNGLMLGNVYDMATPASITGALQNGFSGVQNVLARTREAESLKNTKKLPPNENVYNKM